LGQPKGGKNMIKNMLVLVDDLEHRYHWLLLLSYSMW